MKDMTNKDQWNRVQKESDRLAEVELDELSFYQKLMQDPEHLDETMQAFLDEHPDKVDQVKQARKLNQAIHHTLVKVSPPEQLAERILLRTVATEKLAPSFAGCRLFGCVRVLWDKFKQRFQGALGHLKSSEKWTWMGGGALASVLVFSVVLWGPSVQSVFQATPSVQTASAISDLEQALLAHLHKHPDFIQKTKPISPEQLQANLETFGIQLAQPMDWVTHVSECNIQGIQGVHLVVQSFEGPVTVVMLPKLHLSEMVALKEKAFQIFQGELVPVEGGVLAIFGQTPSQLEWAQSTLKQYVAFESTASFN